MKTGILSEWLMVWFGWLVWMDGLDHKAIT